MREKEINELIKTGEATIIDVRNPEEFVSGHVPGSINIPLNEIPNRIEELIQMKNIIFCCASGNRSNTATAFLTLRGIKTTNGGSWMNLTINTN